MREVDLLRSRAAAAGAAALGAIGVGLLALARYLTNDDDNLILDWGPDPEEEEQDR